MEKMNRQEDRTSSNERCCGNCEHFYDEWFDGTGKCSLAHGGITQCDRCCKCHTYEGDDV